MLPRGNTVDARSSATAVSSKKDIGAASLAPLAVAARQPRHEHRRGGDQRELDRGTVECELDEQGASAQADPCRDHGRGRAAGTALSTISAKDRDDTSPQRPGGGPRLCD